jgi:hypothetical protein
MTKSAEGTAENPGKNVRQKAGRNRSMHAQGIGEVNRQQIRGRTCLCSLWSTGHRCAAVM